jgi:hypothetical protein
MLLSELFQFTPLQHCLFTPDLQWQIQGSRTNLSGVEHAFAGIHAAPLVRHASGCGLRAWAPARKVGKLGAWLRRVPLAPL